MEKFDSITHFLETGGFNYRVYDMGRKVTRLSNQLFQRIENQQEKYPYPFQQKTWLALAFWKEGERKETVIWFLQFPVDEFGFLKQEARDHFLIDLLEQAAKNIQSKQQGELNSDELNESPFAFKPRPERLAMFHALITKELKQEPSKYYQATREYLKGTVGYEQWQFLGLQGIADVVANIIESDNEELLIKAVAEMPQEPLLNFSFALENIQPQGLLMQALLRRIDKEINDNSQNVALVAALIRAISAGEPEKKRVKNLLKVLDSDYGCEIEVLAAISGRSWFSFENNQPLLLRFITNLADQEQASFNAILVDLMMLPKMREKVMLVMRSPERSKKLSNKLNTFLQVLKG